MIPDTEKENKTRDLVFTPQESGIRPVIQDVLDN